MTRLKVGLAAVVLVALGALAPVAAQQSNVTNAVVIAALQAMGLFGDGYTTGTVPTWSATTTRYIPSSGGVIVAGSFQAGVTPVNCSVAQYGFVGDPDTGMGYIAANNASLCAGGTLSGYWNSNGIYGRTFILDTSSADVVFNRAGVGYAMVRTGPVSSTATRFAWANTWTNATSHETFDVDWQTTANIARVGTRTAATGTRRPLQIVAQDSNGADAYLMWQLDRTTAPLMRFGYYNAALTAQSTSPTEFIRLADYVNTATSGTVTNVTITPTYNQAASTAANTDLLINRTQTAVGSGAQLLIDAQVAGVSQFSVRNDGVVTGVRYDGNNSTGAFRYTGSGKALVTSASNTVTTDNPLIDVAQTWNAGGVTFTGWKLNITSTASAAASLLADLQVAGASMFSVRKDGLVTAASNVVSNGSVLSADSAGVGAQTTTRIIWPADGTARVQNNGATQTFDIAALTNHTRLEPESASIGAGGTFTVTTTTAGGWVMVVNETDNYTCIFLVSGAAVTELSDPAASCSVASGTANSVNVYTTGGNVDLQQNEAGTKSLRTVIIR